MCWWFSWSLGSHNWLCVEFRWRWRYRCCWFLSCHWFCTGVIVGIVVRSWCVDAFRCQFCWLSQINPVVVVVAGIGLNFVWSLIIPPYYSGLVSGFMSKFEWTHSWSPSSGGGGRGCRSVGCSICLLSLLSLYLLVAFGVANSLWFEQVCCSWKRCFRVPTKQFLCRAGVCLSASIVR